MAWTILVLVVAIVLYFGASMLKHGTCSCSSDDKKKLCPCKTMLPKLVKLVSIVLLIIGVNMSGCGTKYYLVKRHPEMIQAMAEGMKAKEGELQAKKLKKVMKDESSFQVNAPIAGNVNAKKTIYLFTDHSCPYCKRVHDEIMKVLSGNNDVKVVIKTFSIHGPLSDAPAKAIIAAKLQGNDKAVALHNALMAKSYLPSNMDRSNATKLDAAVRDSVLRVARTVGLDTVKLAEDMNGSVVAEEIQQTRTLAGDLGVNGTPFLIVEGKTFPGAIPASKINEALN